MESVCIFVRLVVGCDVLEVDNVFFIEVVDEGGEVFLFDVVDG